MVVGLAPALAPAMPLAGSALVRVAATVQMVVTVAPIASIIALSVMEHVLAFFPKEPGIVSWPLPPEIQS